MKLKLIAKKPEAGNAVSFTFEPEVPLMWEAGQYMHYGLPKPDKVDDTMERYFTISSAPHTGTPQITTRVSGSPFKQALDSLQIGETIDSRGPEGDFVWPDTDLPIIFIAGGIGVTPFHSMLTDRSLKGKKVDVTLVYANRNDSIIFKEEFDALAKKHPEFKLEYVIGHPFDFDKLLKAVPNITKSQVYISGAEAMVERISHELRDIMPDDQIKQDFFPGYNYDTA